MAKKRKLDSYESQAGFSVLLGSISLLSSLALLAICLQTFDPQAGVVYRQGSLRLYAILGGLGGGIFAGAIGLLLGFNSAGQKSNPLSSRSWMGFFISAAGLTVTTAGGLFFYFNRFPIP